MHEAPEGENIEHLLLDLERMKAALDKPALILAEWQQHWASRKAAQDLDARQAMTANAGRWLPNSGSPSKRDATADHGLSLRPAVCEVG